DIDAIFADNLGLPKRSDQPVGESNQTKDSLGRLERLANMMDGSDLPDTGRISNLSKFLFDSKDVEKLGKIADSNPADLKMRKLTADAAVELRKFLEYLDKQKGVTGSLIVTLDGSILASTMSPEVDVRSFAARALGIHMGTTQLAKKLGSQ